MSNPNIGPHDPLHRSLLRQICNDFQRLSSIKLDMESAPELGFWVEGSSVKGFKATEDWRDVSSGYATIIR